MTQHSPVNRASPPLNPTGQARVFVVQETPVDCSPAAIYGKLTPMLGRDARPRGEYFEIKYHLAEKMRDITSFDWLLPTGDPVAIGIASAIMVANTGTLRMLRWDRVIGSYQAIEIPMA